MIQSLIDGATRQLHKGASAAAVRSTLHDLLNTGLRSTMVSTSTHNRRQTYSLCSAEDPALDASHREERQLDGGELSPSTSTLVDSPDGQAGSTRSTYHFKVPQ